MSLFCLGGMGGDEDLRMGIARLVLRRHADSVKTNPGEPVLVRAERKNLLVSRLGREGGSLPADENILRQSGFVKEEKIPEICQALEAERQERARSFNLAPAPGPRPAA